MLGFSFLVEWVYQTWFRLPKVDYFVICLILIVIATVGFLEGVAVGLLAAVILFVINYSRIEVIKHTLTSDAYHGSITRPRMQRRLLRSLGKQIFILELQGFIFFGTANLLLEEIRLQLARYAGEKLCFVVLDFTRVTGIDSSVVLSFQKLKQQVRPYHARVVLTGLSPGVHSQLEKAGLWDKTDRVFKVFSALDHGVEWCEDQLLRSTGVHSKDYTKSIEKQIEDLFGNPEHVPQILKYLEREEIPAGAHLIHQETPAEGLYFIEEGRVTAQLELSEEEPHRLQTMSGENVVGEVGLYLGGKRTASVVADSPSIVYRLSRESIAKMEREDPHIAALFHKALAALMADRISHLTSTVETLLR